MNSPISPKWCRANGVALIEKSGAFFVAVADDSDELLQEKLRAELNSPFTLQVKTPAEIRRLQRGTDADTVELTSQEPTTNTSWESEPIINLVDSLLDQGMHLKATDIHLEPGKNRLRVRLRQDGLLNDFKTLPSWCCEPVLARLKILAEIDITDKRIPHDGSFTYNGLKGNANIRVSTLPVQRGEKCVLRLLPLEEESSGDQIIGLEALHLSPKSLCFLRQVFNAPQGLFLVTGPTGSGKTTTLHAGIQEILHRQINVITIEDPVEYPLEGASQVQVNEKCGFTFAKALRSILRQDPDVILVGEIRDGETAQIAIRAAQTGHLVLSTLHTNNAKAAFTRLQDLGITPSLIQDSLLGIMAQRLVRCKSRGGSGPYQGRRALTELLKPDGTYVDGSLKENAKQLLQQNITDEAEVERVLGNHFLY